MDLIGIGECLVEFTQQTDDRTSADDPTSYKQDYAGDVLNTLSMASCFGLSLGLVSAFGDDAFTNGLLSLLGRLKVDLSCAPVLNDSYNGVYFVQRPLNQPHTFHFLRKHSAATQALVRQDASKLRDYLLQSRAILFSAIPLAVMDESYRLFELLKECAGKVQIYFDLNVRAALWPSLDTLRELLPVLATFVDVLFVTDDDDRQLFGRSFDLSLDTYSKLGFPVVIGRRGAQPTIIRENEKLTQVQCVAGITVVDSTGAGDAFNAGFIAYRLRGEDILTAARWGNCAAAEVIGSLGGRNEHATLAQMESSFQHLSHAS